MKNIVLISSILFSLSGASFAHDKMEKMDLTKEQRESMATMHENMAKCLRSDKSVQDCHKEMKSDCEKMGDKCPMKEHGKHWDKKKDKE